LDDFELNLKDYLTPFVFPKTTFAQEWEGLDSCPAKK